MTAREGALLRGAAAVAATRYTGAATPRTMDGGVSSSGPSFRLGDVYAAELTRLRQQAHAEGYASLLYTYPSPPDS
jgi:flagellar assembly protein FliH